MDTSVNFENDFVCKILNKSEPSCLLEMVLSIITLSFVVTKIVYIAVSDYFCVLTVGGEDRTPYGWGERPRSLLLDPNFGAPGSDGLSKCSV